MRRRLELRGRQRPEGPHGTWHGDEPRCPGLGAVSRQRPTGEFQLGAASKPFLFIVVGNHFYHFGLLVVVEWFKSKSTELLKFNLIIFAPLPSFCRAQGMCRGCRKAFKSWPRFDQLKEPGLAITVGRCQDPCGKNSLEMAIQRFVGWNANQTKPITPGFV